MHRFCDIWTVLLMMCFSEGLRGCVLHRVARFELGKMCTMGVKRGHARRVFLEKISFYVQALQNL